MNTKIELDKARRFAWFNLIAGFIAYFYILGFPAVLMPNLYPYIISDTGWSRGEVTSFASYKFVTMTLFVFMLVFFIERMGAKRLLITGIIINGLSMGCFIFIDSLWMYYGLAVCFGLGAISGNVAIKVLISRWYYARQGRAIGFALMGSGIAGVVAPVVIEMMTQAIGWKFTVVYLSMGIWIFILPLILYLTHDDPEEFGYTSQDLDAAEGSDKTSNTNNLE